MTFTKSLTMIVPAAEQDACNRLMRGLDRDTFPDPGRTFSVELNLTGDRLDPVSHYGAHTWDDDLVDILDSATLPSGINWSRVGLSESEAGDALAAIRYRAVVNRRPRENFDAELATRGLRLPADVN